MGRCVLQLGAAGVIYCVEVDTLHFKGNYPEAIPLPPPSFSLSPPFSLQGGLPRGNTRTRTRTHTHAHTHTHTHTQEREGEGEGEGEWKDG